MTDEFVVTSPSSSYTIRHFVIRHRLHLILTAALALRLVYAWAQDPLAAYATGGDSLWYLVYGYGLATGVEGVITLPGLPQASMPVGLSNIPTPPLYLLFIGFMQVLLSPTAAIITIRILQALMGTAICFFAYRMARAIAGERAGLIAALALAISPAFVIEPAAVLSETLYMFLVSAALWLYTELLTLETVGTRTIVSLRNIGAGALLGLATLTRAVLLAFPLGLVIHMLLACGWREGFKRAALLLAAYVLVVSTWTIYNRVAWGRWVIAAPGFSSFLYLGAAGWDDPEQVDRTLAEQAGVEGELPSNPDEQQKLYSEVAADLILSDLGGYLRRRVSDLGDAYLQPHGTIYFGGESLKDAAANWLQNDRAPGGLLQLTQGDWFWPKLAIYSFHYAGLVFGLVGMWLARKQWRLALPLMGFILYTTLVHFVLDALPRYIFPTMIFWWVFAGIGLNRWWSRRAAAGR